MTARFHLVCEVCAEEFLVAEAVYQADPNIVQCPRCGSTDLVLLVDSGEAEGSPAAPATA